MKKKRTEKTENLIFKQLGGMGREMNEGDQKIKKCNGNLKAIISKIEQIQEV